MKYILSLLLITTSLFSFSQSKSETILNKLSTKIKGLTSFYVEFTGVVKNEKTGLNESEIGRGWVKGNKFHAAYGENTIISNGIKTWIVEKESKTIYESDASDSDDMINPKKLMTIWETGFTSTYDKESTVSDESVYVINLSPTSKKNEYNSIVVYVSKNYELKKVSMKTKDGTNMTYTLTKFTQNPQVEDQKFTLDKKRYPGYSVIKD